MKRVIVLILLCFYCIGSENQEGKAVGMAYF